MHAYTVHISFKNVALQLIIAFFIAVMVYWFKNPLKIVLKYL